MANFNASNPNRVYGKGLIFEAGERGYGWADPNYNANQTQLEVDRPTVVPWELSVLAPNDPKPALQRDWGLLLRLRPVTPYPVISYMEIGSPVWMGSAGPTLDPTDVVTPPPVGFYYCPPFGG